MKAVVVRQLGGPAVLRLEEVPAPAPGPGQVLLRVEAAGVNYADLLLRAGHYGDARPPLVPGLEAAGTVAALGPGVTVYAAGDRVCGWVQAGYAEYAVADAAHLFPLPPGLAAADAAAFPTAFGTAWHALASLAGLQPGQTALVHAAGSGVGAAALQLARRLSARTIATSTQHWKLERARALGCDLGVDTRADTWPAAIAAALGARAVNVALEGVGRATLSGTIECMAHGGRIVLYGAPSGRRATIDLLALIWRGITLRGSYLQGDPEFPATARALAAEILPALARGELSASVDRVLPRADAPLAHRLLDERQVFGKLVLVP